MHVSQCFKAVNFGGNDRAVKLISSVNLSRVLIKTDGDAQRRGLVCAHFIRGTSLEVLLIVSYWLKSYKIFGFSFWVKYPSFCQ